METEIMRLSSKGQLTIPVSIRKILKIINKGDYIQIRVEENEIRLRKIETIRPLSADDPFWKMIGAGDSGLKDVSVNHDH